MKRRSPFLFLFLFASSIVTSEVQAFQPEPLVDARLADNIELRSFAYDANDQHLEDDLWGVDIDWLLTDSLSTNLDYTLLSVADSSDPASGTNLQQFLQLGVDHRGKHLALGARYYSASENYDASALGRRLLAQSGLAEAGEGAEYWARWRAGTFKLRPRLRRTVLQQGGGLRTDELYDVALERSFGGPKIRLEVARQFQSWLHNGLESRSSEQDRLALRYHDRGWHLMFSSMQQRRKQQPEQPVRNLSTQQVGASFKVGKRWSVRPSFTHTSGINEQHQRAVVAVNVLTPRLPVDNLNLNVNLFEREQNARLSALREVRLVGSRQLHWLGGSASTTRLSASLLYRERIEPLLPASQNEFGFKFTLTHAFES